MKIERSTGELTNTSLEGNALLTSLFQKESLLLLISSPLEKTDSALFALTKLGKNYDLPTMESGVYSPSNTGFSSVFTELLLI